MINVISKIVMAVVLCLGTLGFAESWQPQLRYSYAPSQVAVGSLFDIGCDFGTNDLPCIAGYHGTGNCRWVGWRGTVATFECFAPAPGEFQNFCNLFYYAPDYRCQVPQQNPISSTYVYPQ